VIQPPTTSPAHLAFLAATGSQGDLEDWGPLEEATGPAMHTAGLTLWEAGEQSAGIWECTAGPSYWVQDQHELVHILAGTMTVTEDGGEPVTVTAGDTVMFPKGWSGTWDITETLRKVYVLF
jgi:uncharacterized cupin superfamily protein